MGRLVATWAAITAAGIAVHAGPTDVIRLTLQSSFYLALGIFMARQPALRSILAGLPRSGRNAIFAFVGASVLCQLAERSTVTFPLVTWDMYTERTVDDPVYYEFTGVTADGVDVELNFAREFRGLSRKVEFGLQRIVGQLDEETGSDSAESLKTKYENTVKALARNYNRVHPDRPVRVVRVWRRTIPSSPFRGLATVESALDRELSVD